jgi:hypothetical protein
MRFKTGDLGVALLGAAILAVPAAAAEKATTYGKPLEGLPVASLASILDHPEAGKRVRLTGTVAKVCRNKGCWLELRQGERSAHVTFAGYSFFVPTDSAGSEVVLEGRVVVKEPPPDEVEHKQAEGAGPSVAAKVSIEATGVELKSK